MKTSHLKFFVVAVAALAVAGCAAPQSPQMPWASFEAQDLNGKLRSGAYEQKADCFLVVMDASGTMREGYEGRMKMDIAKSFIWALDQTIPDIPLTSGLRTLGQNFSSDSRLIYGMTAYAKGAPGAAAAGVSGGGLTPLGLAIAQTADDLKNTRGQIALIVVSDGKETDMMSVSGVEALKSQFGDRICIYPVLVGDDAEGRALMEAIARKGECGFMINASDAVSSAGMADFVTRVFLAEVPPPPPAEPEAEVIEPRDSDGDGVPDDIDQCPDTPYGATVDGRGCWAYDAVVLFDLDSAELRAEAYPMLDEAAAILKQNPAIGVEIQGHTCSLGSEAHNQALSERRARSVMDYFISHGISADRLTAEGYGEGRPAYPNNTEESRQKNRRVELKPVR